MNTRKLKRIIAALRKLGAEHPASAELAASTMSLSRLLDRWERRDFVREQVDNNQLQTLINSL